MKAHCSRGLCGLYFFKEQVRSDGLTQITRLLTIDNMVFTASKSPDFPHKCSVFDGTTSNRATSIRLL